MAFGLGRRQIVIFLVNGLLPRAVLRPGLFFGHSADTKNGLLTPPMPEGQNYLIFFLNLVEPGGIEPPTS
jgi:hypothetical protein